MRTYTSGYLAYVKSSFLKYVIVGRLTKATLYATTLSECALDTTLDSRMSQSLNFVAFSMSTQLRLVTSLETAPWSLLRSMVPHSSGFFLPLLSFIGRQPIAAL